MKKSTNHHPSSTTTSQHGIDLILGGGYYWFLVQIRYKHWSRHRSIKPSRRSCFRRREVRSGVKFFFFPHRHFFSKRLALGWCRRRVLRVRFVIQRLRHFCER